MCTVDLYDVFRVLIMCFRDSPVFPQIFLCKSESQDRSWESPGYHGNAAEFRGLHCTGLDL